MTTSLPADARPQRCRPTCAPARLGPPPDHRQSCRRSLIGLAVVVAVVPLGLVDRTT